MMSGIGLCSKRQMNCMEWIYMRTILIYHLKRRSGGIIREIKNRNLVKKICVDGGEKRIFHQFLMKIITPDIDADSIVEMIYRDSANEG